MFSSRVRILASTFPVRRLSSEAGSEAIKTSVTKNHQTLTQKIAKGVVFTVVTSIAVVYSFVYYSYKYPEFAAFVRASNPDHNFDSMAQPFKRHLIKLGFLERIEGDDT